MLVNYLNLENEKIEEKQIDVKLDGLQDLLLLNKPFCLNLENNTDFNIFNLEEITEQNLNKQLSGFNNNRPNIIYLNDVVNFEDDYDVIVPFCKKNNVKLVVKAGYSLNEMGECDKVFGKTPIDLLEEFGVLDLEPIILSGARLEKEDLEKLSYYNATICLDVSNDLLAGNGVAPITTMQQKGLNIMLNVRNDVFEEIRLIYLLSAGIYNCNQSYANVLKMAFSNGYKAFGLQANESVLVSGVKPDYLKNLVLNCNKNMVVNTK